MAMFGLKEERKKRKELMTCKLCVYVCVWKGKASSVNEINGNLCGNSTLKCVGPISNSCLLAIRKGEALWP